jgi:hypothetical protein
VKEVAVLTGAFPLSAFTKEGDRSMVIVPLDKPTLPQGRMRTRGLALLGMGGVIIVKKTVI